MQLLSRSKSGRGNKVKDKSPDNGDSAAEEHIRIRLLKDQVQSLKESNRLLSSELANANEKNAATLTTDIDNKLQVKEQATNKSENAKLQKTIGDLTMRNRELQSKLESVQHEKTIYAATLAEEVKTKSVKPEQAQDPTSNNANEDREVQKAIDGYLLKRNRELEEYVATLSEAVTKLEQRLDGKGGKSHSDFNEDGESQYTINELTKQNQELEEHLANIFEEKSSLESMLAKEKSKSQMRKDAEKERKERLQSLLADTSEKIHEGIDISSSFAERQKKFESKLAEMMEEFGGDDFESS